jgi:hypothetical protein
MQAMFGAMADAYVSVALNLTEAQRDIRRATSFLCRSYPHERRILETTDAAQIDIPGASKSGRGGRCRKNSGR